MYRWWTAQPEGGTKTDCEAAQVSAGKCVRQFEQLLAGESVRNRTLITASTLIMTAWPLTVSLEGNTELCWLILFEHC